MMDKVKFGFFPQLGDPAILFFGSAKALEALQRVLLLLEKNKYLKLENDNHFIPLNKVKLTLSLTDSARGMRIENGGKSTFKWNLSKDDAIQLSEKVSSVINSMGPSHDYLDGSFDEIQVVVSKDEYPDSFTP